MKNRFIPILLCGAALVAISAFDVSPSYADPPNVITNSAAPTAVQEAANFVTLQINNEAKHRVLVDEVVYQKIWNSPDPAAVVAALGTQAKLVFAFASADVAYFHNIEATAGLTTNSLLPVQYQGPPSWASVQINSDGSATVTGTPPVSVKKPQ